MRSTQTTAVLYISLTILSLVAVDCVAGAGGEWRRFRGPNGTGVSAARGLPTEFGPEKNVVWKVSSDRGNSSPILSGGNLFITSFHDNERTVRCLDAQTGALRWKKSVLQTREEIATQPNGPATPTPVSDGKNVYVFFPDVGLLSYSHEGAERWRTELEPFYSMHGIASSLMVADGKVVLVIDQLKGSYLAAFDVGTGQVAWKRGRVSGVTGGYSTPSIYKTTGGSTRLVVSGPLELVGYDVKDGHRKWWLRGLTNAPISLPVMAENQFFVCEPFYEGTPFKKEELLEYDRDKDGKVTLRELASDVSIHRLAEGIDQGSGDGNGVLEAAEVEKAFGHFAQSGGLAAVALGGSGDLTETHVRWSYRKSLPQVASPLLYDGVLYIINDGGVLMTLQPSTGDVIKQGRLKAGGRNYHASPVAADGKVFLLDVDGKMAVVKSGADWQWLASNDLGEPCHGTPAIGDGRLYVRTETSLYCFGKD